MTVCYHHLGVVLCQLGKKHQTVLVCCTCATEIVRISATY